MLLHLPSSPLLLKRIDFLNIISHFHPRLTLQSLALMTRSPWPSKILTAPLLVHFPLFFPRLSFSSPSSSSLFFPSPHLLGKRSPLSPLFFLPFHSPYFEGHHNLGNTTARRPRIHRVVLLLRKRCEYRPRTLLFILSPFDSFFHSTFLLLPLPLH